MLHALSRFFSGVFRDVNDARLERMEAERMANLQRKLAEDGDAESILQRVYVEHEADAERQPQERMTGLMIGSDNGARHWVDKLLTQYLFNLTINADTGEVILTDRRHIGLKNREVKLPVGRLREVDERTLRRVLANARSIINRRAQRAGLLAKKTRQGTVGKREGVKSV